MNSGRIDTIGETLRKVCKRSDCRDELDVLERIYQTICSNENVPSEARAKHIKGVIDGIGGSD